MSNTNVPIGDSVRRGWAIFKENALFLVVVFIVVSIVYAIIERVEEVGDTLPFPLGLLIAIGYAVAFAIVEIGIVNVSLRLIDGAKPEFDDLVSAIDVLVKYLIALLLYGLMIGFGLLVLVIPGIYLAIKFGFFGYFIVDKQLDPLDALRESSRMTAGIKLQLFSFYLLLFAIFVLGLLCFVVGVYVSWPVTRLAVANVYRELEGKPARTEPAQ